MRVMGAWLFNLPILWLAAVIFAATYLVAAGVYLVVVGLAVNGVARVFKAFSPGNANTRLASSWACLSVLSPCRLGMTSIRPRLRLPQRPAYSESWLYLMRGSLKSRG